jgi:4-oxalocrotonate tautomerase
MPLVQISMRKGRTQEQKRRLIQRVTDALVEEAGARPERVTVIIQDVAPEDWATGGTTLADEVAAAR